MNLPAGFEYTSFRRVIYLYMHMPVARCCNMPTCFILAWQPVTLCHASRKPPCAVQRKLWLRLCWRISAAVVTRHGWSTARSSTATAQARPRPPTTTAAMTTSGTTPTRVHATRPWPVVALLQGSPVARAALPVCVCYARMRLLCLAGVRSAWHAYERRSALRLVYQVVHHEVARALNARQGKGDCGWSVTSDTCVAPGCCG